MLCGGFYLILGFSVRDNVCSVHFFLPLKGQSLDLVLNPILVRQASPCVVLNSLEQQQQFYTALSYLYPTIPHSTLKVLWQPLLPSAPPLPPLGESFPISPVPRPHT